MISIKTHNVLDYVAGVLLLLMPAIAGFASIDAARNVFVLGGLALIGYSLFTKYDYALWRKIPLGVHMVLDVTVGVLVMAAPFLFDYRFLLTGGQEIVHYAMGLGAILLVAITRQKTTSASVGQDFRDLTGKDDYRRAG
jgi:hypothetical protein